MSVTLALAALLSVGTRPAPTVGPAAGGRPAAPEGIAALAARMRTPSFARQTRLGCGVCHLGGFPQLTRFGRLFKLNGYTMSGLPQITEPVDSASRRSLELSSIPGLSVMAIVSGTRVGRPLPGTQATRTEYPQQLSLFLGGEISPKLGTLVELTYAGATGTLALDNTDVRFATHTRMGSHDILYGVTLHNNPTVQDAWNTAPAWSFPFISPALAPHPAAATLIDGRLAQSVLGLGTYVLADNMLYAEVSGYTSAPGGPRSIVDSTERNTTRGVAPYWRVALQNRTGPFYMMVGTYGFFARLFPVGSAGRTNDYHDVGVDAQFERASGQSAIVGRVSYTRESQVLDAYYSGSPRFARNVSNTLRTIRANAMYTPTPLYSLTLGYFETSGSRDDLLYPSTPVTGSRTGSPDTRGEVGEVTLSPWLNTRLGLQYTVYQRFNGSASAYDVTGAARSAGDNRTLYLYLWFAF